MALVNKRANRILRKLWRRSKLKSPRRNSLRSLAKAVHVSPGYLSKIFSEDKPLKLPLAKKLIAQLKVDDLSKNFILSSFGIVSSSSIRRTQILNPSIESYEITAESAEWILARWYRLSLLDLMTTVDFNSDVNWMAKRLGVPTQEIKESLEKMIKENLVTLDENGVYRKKHLKLRFPTSFSKEIIRSHHKAQMMRAISIMEKQTSPADFNKRLIVGVSVACNPKNIEKVKSELHAALYEAAAKLSEGECREVYQLSLQIFPQTN